MNKKFLVLGLVTGVVALLSFVFAVSSFFYFKGKAIDPSCLKVGLQVELPPEALEECLSKSSTSQEIVVTTSSIDDSHAFDLCKNVFTDFASLKLGDCYADAVVKGFTDNGLNNSGGSDVVFGPHNGEVLAYVRGTYTCIDKSSVDDAQASWFTGSVCFVPDDDSGLPRFEGDKNRQGFCFNSDNNQDAEEIFCSKDKTGRALVWINEYKYSYKNSNSYNTAIKWSAKLEKPMSGVKIGAKIYGMTVKSFFNNDSEKQINFSGQARITGDYSYSDQGEFDGGWACFSNLDFASEAKMPKFPGSEKTKSDFCITNSDLLQKELISVATSGRATIDIDNFNLVYCECGAWSNAELVDVISVEKK